MKRLARVFGIGLMSAAGFGGLALAQATPGASATPVPSNEPPPYPEAYVVVSPAS